jgi:hypothetical protein
MIGVVGGTDLGSFFGSVTRGPFFDGVLVGADFFAIGALFDLLTCGYGFFPRD